MQTIKITLKPSGSMAEFVQDFNIYQGSFDNYIINVAVPVSVFPKSIPNTGDINTIAVNIAEIGIDRMGKDFQTEKHNLKWKKDFTKDGIDYKLYGSSDNDNLDDFTQYAGAHTLVINATNIIQGEGLSTVTKVITSQKCTFTVQPSKYLSNEKPIVPTELDKANANINYLLEKVAKLPLGDYIVKQYNAADMPVGHTYTPNGYNEPLCAYYSISNNVPTTAETTATKQGVSLFSNITPDSETPDIIGYQNEYFYSDSGVVVCRTNKFNLPGIIKGEYDALEVGVWQIINDEYINEIKTKTDINSADISVLKRLVSAGTTYIGEYPTQQEMPSDSEINAFVQSRAGRARQSGDEVTFKQEIAEGTDIIYHIRYSEVTDTWTATPMPTIEAASNKNLGLVKGAAADSEQDIKVDIEDGEIRDITHLNENTEPESISAHLNRNSAQIADNKEKIEENTAAITTETERATNAEQALSEALSSEIEKTNTIEENKLSKENINEDFIQNISFSLNGDTGIAIMRVKNPVSGEMQEFEISVISAASSDNAGLMTSDMAQALSRAVADIESLKYVGRQLASFETYADAQLFDWTDTEAININDYFIVNADESRTAPTEQGRTTKYVCISKSEPITTVDSFRFQSVVTTVSIQVATETNLGGVLSLNVNGYIYVEPNGAMKLVGYDGILSSITNLTTALTEEITRAKTAEERLDEIKADKEELPTKLSELENDSGFITEEAVPTNTSELTNDSNFATVGQIPTKISELVNDSININNKQDKLTAEQLSNIDDIPNKITSNTWATPTIGGVIKMRVDGDTLYITNDGSDA